MLLLFALVIPVVPFIGLVLWAQYFRRQWRDCQSREEEIPSTLWLQASLLLLLLLCMFAMSFAVYDMVHPVSAEGLTPQPEITLSIPEGGMAPLRVFGDGLATLYGGQPIDGRGGVNSGSKEPVDYRSLRFQWDFGDTGLHNIQSGGSMCAAYVYELPDGSDPVTRTITLTVTDPRTGTAVMEKKEVTVRPFAGTTFYFDAEVGDDRRTPKEAQNPKTPWRSAAQAAFAVNGHRKGAVRCLFRRGQVFPVSKTLEFNNKSGDPLILWGAYGEGPKPLLDGRGMGKRHLFQLNGRCHNWVFVDLALEKSGHPFLEPNGGGDIWDLNGDVDTNSAAQNILFLRCTARGGGTTVTTYRTVHDRETHEQQFRDLTVQDCDFRNASSMILYMGGERVAVLGNVLKANGSQHLLRFWYLGRGVITGNKCEDVCLDQSQGKLRSAMRILSVPKRNYSEALPTRYVIVSSNTIQLGSGTQCFDIASGADDIDTNGRTHHIIFEKNRLLPSVTAPKSPKAYWDLVADNITIRNNVIHGALFDESVYVVRCVDYHASSGGKIDAPKPHNIWVLGNTVYAPHSNGKKLQFVSVVERKGGTGFQECSEDVTGDLVIRNNVAVCGKLYRGEILHVYSDKNKMLSDGQVTADHNLLFPAARKQGWMFSPASGSVALHGWQSEPFHQGHGSKRVDPALADPRLGTQTLEVSSVEGLKVRDRVYGLVSGASGVVLEVGEKSVVVRGVWSGRPFPGKGEPSFDGDKGLWNIDRETRTSVLGASSVKSGDDFSVVPESPAIGAGAHDARLFEDFFGRPRPGAFGRSGKPTMGAVEH